MKRLRDQLFKDWFKVISLVAVLVLPLIYGFLYLWAFWDPYGNLKNVPVAIVNRDKGGVKDNEEYNLGNKLVDKLKDNTSLGWRFVSKDEAETGLEQRRYYSMVIIPENFSESVLSAQEEKPQTAYLQLTSREATNFMSAKFSETATIKLVAELNKEVEEEYWKNVFVSLREIRDKLGDAADGASELHDGLSDAVDGNQKIIDGLNTAKNGSNDLYDGLVKLSNGSKDLKNGIGTAKAGQTSLISGMTTVDGGLGVFASNISTLQTGVNTISGGISQNKAGVDQAIALLDDPNNIGTVKTILSGVSNGLSSVNGGVASVSAGLQAANTGLNQLKAGSGQAITGAKQVSTGLITLYSGAERLESGLNEAKSGSSTLHNGIASLLDGSQKLGEGLNEARDGSKTLADKLADGEKEVADKASVQKENAQVSVLSQPVSYESVPRAKVANNGSGFAPYFVPLALWVGAMSIFFIIEKPVFSPKTIAFFGLVGVGQATLLCLSLIKILGMNVVDVRTFILFAVALSWCYMSIQALINHLLGDAGKFVNILLLMLQITSSAGSYPLETSPLFFQRIHPYLPMTYAVTALREIISGGNMPLITNQAKVIVIMGMVFFGLNMLRQIVIIKYARDEQED